MSSSAQLQTDERLPEDIDTDSESEIIIPPSQMSPQLPSKGIKRRKLDFDAVEGKQDDVDGLASIGLVLLLRMIIRLFPQNPESPKELQSFLEELFDHIDDGSLLEVLGSVMSQLDNIFRTQKISSWKNFWDVLRRNSSSTTSFPCQVVKRLTSYLKNLFRDKGRDVTDSASTTSMQQTQTGTTSMSSMTAATTKATAVVNSYKGSILDVDAISSSDLEAVSQQSTTNISWNIFSKNSKGRCTSKWPMKIYGSHVAQIHFYPSAAIKNLPTKDWWKTKVKSLQCTVDIEDKTMPILGVSQKTDAEFLIRQGLQNVIIGMSQLKDLEVKAQNPNLEVTKEIMHM
uniref:Nonstructural protein 2 n=1 Tax=Phoenicurus auroreus ambidensovirus TaxID=2794456 RepID=A0A8A4XC58_9VIRU|nr:MAG: nonstructural protein 2 [Phoenicurus auroreus ambidensovirus]